MRYLDRCKKLSQQHTVGRVAVKSDKLPYTASSTLRNSFLQDLYPGRIDITSCLKHLPKSTA